MYVYQELLHDMNKYFFNQSEVILNHTLHVHEFEHFLG